MDITVTSPCLLPSSPPVSSPTISLPRLFFSRICRRIRFSRCSVELAGFQSRFVRDCRRPLSPKIITSSLQPPPSSTVATHAVLKPQSRSLLVLFRCASRHFNIIPPRRWSKSEKNETKPGKTALLKNDSAGFALNLVLSSVLFVGLWKTLRLVSISNNFKLSSQSLK